MEGESFTGPEIVRIPNEYFIPIKIDRMEAVQFYSGLQSHALHIIRYHCRFSCNECSPVKRKLLWKPFYSFISKMD
ncbi:MAG: hypothetical protein AB1847_03245 [bacterium]